jgi:hypothetical protein
MTVFFSEGSKTTKLLRPVMKILWTAWSPDEGQGKQGSARRPSRLEMARKPFPLAILVSLGLLLVLPLVFPWTPWQSIKLP